MQLSEEQLDLSLNCSTTHDSGVTHYIFFSILHILSNSLVNLLFSLNLASMDNSTISLQPQVIYNIMVHQTNLHMTVLKPFLFKSQEPHSTKFS